MAAAGAELYQEVKRASDSFFGIPSQCFVSSNAGINNPGKMRGRLQYCANVALKVRAAMQYGSAVWSRHRCANPGTELCGSPGPDLPMQLG